MDVTKLSQVRGGVASVVKRYSGINAVIAAAGGRAGADVGAFTEAPVETWMQIIELHLTGVLNLYYAALPHMRAKRSGALIAISSVEAYRGLPDSAVYSTAKAAVAVLTGLAELGEDGATHSAVSAGQALWVLWCVLSLAGGAALLEAAKRRREAGRGGGAGFAAL